LFGALIAPSDEPAKKRAVQNGRQLSQWQSGEQTGKYRLVGNSIRKSHTSSPIGEPGWSSSKQAMKDAASLASFLAMDRQCKWACRPLLCSSLLSFALFGLCRTPSRNCRRGEERTDAIIGRITCAGGFDRSQLKLNHEQHCDYETRFSQ